MALEEQLENLIARWEHDARLWLVESGELEARLAAAEALIQGQRIAVPPAFAARLEVRLRARARSLVAQPGKALPFPSSPAQRRRRERSDTKRQRGHGFTPYPFWVATITKSSAAQLSL